MKISAIYGQKLNLVALANREIEIGISHHRVPLVVRSASPPIGNHKGFHITKITVEFVTNILLFLVFCHCFLPVKEKM
jgi:hypothetical protein